MVWTSPISLKSAPSDMSHLKLLFSTRPITSCISHCTVWIQPVKRLHFGHSSVDEVDVGESQLLGVSTWYFWDQPDSPIVYLSPCLLAPPQCSYGPAGSKEFTLKRIVFKTGPVAWMPQIKIIKLVLFLGISLWTRAIRDDWRHLYCATRGEILGPLQEIRKQKHLLWMFSLIKSKSWRFVKRQGAWWFLEE